MSDILFLDNDDDVLDVINDMPEETRSSCLKFLSQEPDKCSSFVFLLDDRGYGVIMKFVQQGSEGLVFMGGEDADSIISVLEQLRDSVDGVLRQEVEERLNAVRYSFALIRQKYAEELTKKLK